MRQTLEYNPPTGFLVPLLDSPESTSFTHHWHGNLAQGLFLEELEVEQACFWENMSTHVLF